MGGVLLAAATDTPAWVSAAVAIAAAAVVAWRERGVRQAIREKESELRDLFKEEVALFQAGNQELRAQIEDAERRYEIAQQECRVEVAKLSGQVTALRSDFARQVAEQVVEQVVTAVHQAVRGDRRADT